MKPTIRTKTTKDNKEEMVVPTFERSCCTSLAFWHVDNIISFPDDCTEAPSRHFSQIEPAGRLGHGAKHHRHSTLSVFPYRRSWVRQGKIIAEVRFVVGGQGKTWTAQRSRILVILPIRTATGVAFNNNDIRGGPRGGLGDTSLLDILKTFRHSFEV